MLTGTGPTRTRTRTLPTAFKNLQVATKLYCRMGLCHVACTHCSWRVV